MVDRAADQIHLQRAVEVMTAWLEDDDFELAKRVLTFQFQEGGIQAVIDLAIGLAHMNYMNLAQLENVTDGVSKLTWLQMIAETSLLPTPSADQ